MVANIRLLMKQQGINQKQLAGLADFGESALSNIMSGRNGVRKDNLYKIAFALGVSPEQLLLPMATDAAPEPGVQEPAAEFGLPGRSLEAKSGQVQLRFVPFSAYGRFGAGHRGEFELYWVRKEPGKRYDDAWLLEIRGNSMAPRYPNGSRYVVRPVPSDSQPYAQGVHALSLKGELIIKRIKSNKNGVLLLSSDINDQEMTVLLSDIDCMWKVGEASYMPEED